jgi:DHA2 family multidrug resistance protein
MTAGDAAAVGGGVAAGASARPTLGTWLGFMALVVGNFVAVLDIQVVGASINELQAGLSASVDEIHWIQTAYLIAEVIAIPLSGYLSRMLSTRIYFVAASLGFTLASAACAFSWNLGSMVVFRVIQGFLGGGMVPTLFAAMYLMFPEDQRGPPIVIAGMTSMLAPSLGPTFGGYITEIGTWHWLFLINLVPGLLTAAAAWRWLHVDKPQPEMLSKTDFLGAGYMAVFLGCFEYALDEGPRNDWFSDSSVTLCALAALVTGVLFFWRSLRNEHPIVELRAFRNRNFAIGSMLVAVVGMCLYSLVYVTPLFLAEIRGYNPMQIGEVMMVQGIAMFFTAPIMVQLENVLSERTRLAIGLVFMMIGCWLNSHMTADWGYREFIVPQIFRGFGVVTCFISMTNIAMGTLPADEVKNASGLYNVARNIGGAIGLALITTLMNHRTWLHWQTLAEATSAERGSVADALGQLSQSLQPTFGSQSPAAAFGMLARQAETQALTMSFNDINWLLSMSLLCTLPLLLLISRPRADLHLEGMH